MKPILFNTEMVRRILEGRKTCTRRVVKPQPETEQAGPCTSPYGNSFHDGFELYKPPYQPGDILYVRETWCDPSGTGWPILYKADMPMHWDAKDTEHGEAVDMRAEDYQWRPSIHMPKDAARLFLLVKSVRVERLQDITPEQIDAEGCNEFAYSAETGEPLPSNPSWFKIVWDKTIPKHPNKFKRYPYYWDDNPWVWVIEFEKIGEEVLKAAK